MSLQSAKLFEGGFVGFDAGFDVEMREARAGFVDNPIAELMRLPDVLNVRKVPGLDSFQAFSHGRAGMTQSF